MGCKALLPEELAAESMAVAAGSGRTSPNQTRTHRQCTKCQRVLRNDLFYQPESYARRGLVFPRCLDCTRNRNVGSYAPSANGVQTKGPSRNNHIRLSACAVGDMLTILNPILSGL